MKVVLDTNSLLVSIGKKSKYRLIFDKFISGEVTLLISNDTLSEYIEIIEQKTNKVVADNISDLLMSSPDVEKIEIYFKWLMIEKDADDNKFVDCALNGQADYLVTDDKYFNLLRTVGFPPIKVVRTKEFTDILNNLG